MSEYYKENDIENQVKMDTDEQKEFYYFKLHDYDHNNKLDGLEITAAIRHSEQEYIDSTDKDANYELLSEETLSGAVQETLKSDDTDNDGFISYFEFVTAQRKKKEKLRDNI